RLALIGFVVLAVSGCTPKPTQITLLATNDIHGGIEPTVLKDGTNAGGLAAFSGTVQAIKAGLKRKLGDQAGVLVLDAGDQFQGTLISNYNEGRLLFQSMSQVGYDAAITGNHDYDFGPVGWLEDQVTPTTVDIDPRGALRAALPYARFPLISANTFLRYSLYDGLGNKVQVKKQGCDPIVEAGQPTPVIDWSRAKSPDFLKPYLIKEVGEVRVAVIGIDTVLTPFTTTAANVSDLCFEREDDAYLRVRAQLDGRADVFVLLIHDGNALTAPLSDLVQKLTTASHPAHGAVVDAVISGHTHFTYNLTVAGVPVIQSGAKGTAYGRIDLVYDPKLGGVDRSKTKSYAGVKPYLTKCADEAKDYCEVDPTSKAVMYEGAPFQNDDVIVQLIAKERQVISTIAGQVLGRATAEVKVDRTGESPLADALTDLLRQISMADVAFINTGGIRAPLDPGDVTYEQFFLVIPFNNHGVKMGPMAASTLLEALGRSAQSCGDFGALMQSGLKVVIQKDCNPASGAVGTDTNAKLLHVETLGGRVLLDVAAGIPRAGDADPMLTVATLDFLATGGDGYTMLEGAPLIQDLGIVREVMKDFLARTPATFTPAMDGRWLVQKSPEH
ncbi:MAG TPA: 5'-nucleotidase C-terminal domain-containing protein, partial [Chloroflexota bacterium]|nr:5'-nucleotidase C-terminal domain-containing protein [Chloroflexota bacterium]